MLELANYLGILNWNYIHWLSERLMPLGTIGSQPKSLPNLKAVMYEGFQGGKGSFWGACIIPHIILHSLFFYSSERKFLIFENIKKEIYSKRNPQEFMQDFDMKSKFLFRVCFEWPNYAS